MTRKLLILFALLSIPVLALAAFDGIEDRHAVMGYDYPTGSYDAEFKRYSAMGYYLPGGLSESDISPASDDNFTVLMLRRLFR